MCPPHGCLRLASRGGFSRRRTGAECGRHAATVEDEMQDIEVDRRKEVISLGAWVFAVLLLLAFFALVMTLVLLP